VWNSPYRTGGNPYASTDAGEHDTVELTETTAGPGQFERMVRIRAMKEVHLRSRVYSNTLNVTQLWSDKSTLGLTFVPASAPSCIMHQEPTATASKQIHYEITHATLFAARVIPKMKLPKGIKYHHPRQQLWTVTLARGLSEYATTIIAGAIPHLLVLSFQSEVAHNGTYHTYVC
jgi:hypothetical protein